MLGGSIRLFRFAGIQVSLHFSWFLAAAYFLTSSKGVYASPVYGVYEYLGLFVIVLTHEFGHAFACRSVGGTADQILLWPFGGVAFVRPPPRAGAQLWSIAAGPLVNVVLYPVFFLLSYLIASSGMAEQTPDLYRLILRVSSINLLILCFNLLPVYPLDGGQILRSLLWFPLGQIMSLRIASVVGLIGGAAFVIWAITESSIWLILLSVFLMSQALAGWRHAKTLQLREDEILRGPPPIPPEHQPRPPMV
jgi:Zn-dependent protease